VDITVQFLLAIWSVMVGCLTVCAIGIPMVYLMDYPDDVGSWVILILETVVIGFIFYHSFVS